jgi:16S rRNA (guanine966-N2)-methyltransferase
VTLKPSPRGFSGAFGGLPMVMGIDRPDLLRCDKRTKTKTRRGDIRTTDIPNPMEKLKFPIPPLTFFQNEAHDHRPSQQNARNNLLLPWITMACHHPSKRRGFVPFACMLINIARRCGNSQCSAAFVHVQSGLSLHPSFHRPYQREFPTRDDDTALMPTSAPYHMLLKAQSSSSDATPSSTIPANLRRKVSVQRPPLGHVVPKSGANNSRRGNTAGGGGGGSAGPRLRPQGKRREAGLNNPSMLQISSGSARGRRLDSPDVYLRPMMGKVREAVFSTLTSFGLYDPQLVKSARHLDIFAGSGSVGLESLSRGASHCTFVDLSPDCCATATRNAQWCQFDGEDQVRVVCADAIAALSRPTSVGIPEGSTYDIVTMCPPYEEVVYGDLLEAAVNSPLVGEDTIVLVEYPIELGCLSHVIRRQDGGAMIGIRNRRYGRTVIALYIVNPSGKLEAAYSRPEEFIKL